MRVLVVAGTLSDHQLALWGAVRDAGVDVHLVGTRSTAVGGPLVRADPSTILDEPGTGRDLPAPATFVEPRGVLAGRGVLWWHYRELPELTRRLRPDIVHVLSEAWGRLAGQALRLGFPVVAHGCENLFDQGGAIEAAIRLRVLRRQLPKLDGYVSWNSGGLQRLSTLGIRLPPHTAVVPGVAPDPAAFTAVPPRDPQNRTVGFIGRLADSKGIDVLIRASKLLPAGTRVVVVGTGSELAPLQQLARDLDAAVEFRPAVPPERVADVLADVAVVAVPSRPTRETTEQFGRIAVEAMWARRPVVATRCGALPEVLGDTALLSEVDDVQGLATSLTTLLTDNAVYDRLASSARARAEEHFAPPVLAQQLGDLWQRVAPAAVARS